MKFLKHSELCHVCETYSLSIGLFGLEQCNNCGYSNLTDEKKSPNVYQKTSRFKSIITAFSILPISSINKTLEFLTPYLEKHAIATPTSDLLKQILTLHDIIPPCSSRSYTLVFHLLAFYRKISLELTYEDKLVFLEFFKRFLHDNAHYSDLTINYNCFFAWAYYYITGINLLISPLFIKNSDSFIPMWFEKKLEYFHSEEYQKTQKKITESRLLYSRGRFLQTPKFTLVSI